MTLDPALFSPFAIWAALVLYLACLALALWLAPWRTLLAAADARLLRRHRGADVPVADGHPGAARAVNYHLLGLTAVTLIFGWSFAVIAASIALLGSTSTAA
jgi:uncharacterized membrane protein